ncbi:MAG TPA: glycosyltransferase, partial [Microthrixaceae bacterium]|nr:glycosyltransferase [Microthrixaceae bacterium]
PSDHAVDELAAADVVALTSVWEAVPLVVAEAAQLGRPIVSTDVGIVSELVSDGVDGFVVAVGDADGVAAALIEVLSRGERDEMGRHAREVAVARIDPDRLVDEVVGVYDGLVAPRPGPDPEARS